MNRHEYLKELAQHIRKLPEGDRAEILADYEEHFAVASSKGKSDEEIMASLGKPATVARAVLMNSLVKEATQAEGVSQGLAALFRILFMVLVLAPFNFLMLVGPFLVILTLILVGWVVPVAVGAGLLALFVVGFKFVVFDLGLLTALSVFFMLITVVGLVILAAMTMGWITQSTVRLLVSYFKWNVQLVTSKVV